MFAMGLTSENLTLAGIALFAGAVYVYLKSRSLAKNGHYSQIGWLPFVALVSAPMLSACLWTIQVFVITDEYYHSPSDAWADFPPVMLIGIMVGFVSSITFIVAILLMSRRGD